MSTQTIERVVLDPTTGEPVLAHIVPAKKGVDTSNLSKVCSA